MSTSELNTDWRREEGNSVDGGHLSHMRMEGDSPELCVQPTASSVFWEAVPHTSGVGPQGPL